MAVRAGIILGPQREALAVIALKARIVSVERPARKHKPREDPFGGDFVVFRQRKVVVLDGRVFSPGLLEAVQRSHEDRRASKSARNSPETHAWASNPRIAPSSGRRNAFG